MGESEAMQYERDELHFRRIDMRGYRRSDGLFEVEGRVTDRRAHQFQPGGFGEMVPAHQAVHDMGVRLVFDDRLMVMTCEPSWRRRPTRSVSASATRCGP